MKPIPSIKWLSWGTAIVLLLAITGCSKKPSTTADGTDDITALRQEVAVLREEVAQLRQGGRRTTAGSNSKATNGNASPEDAGDELSVMRAQLAAARREMGSNLVQIAVDRGGDAWRRGDYKAALKLLKPLAESGEPIAAHRLGVMYVFGQGVPKDSAEAIKWFAKAAEQGQGESQHSLGLRYLWGDGVDKNPETAAGWFNAAANQGIPDSATWLGDIFWNGTGVQQDLVEGYKWMLLAGDKFSINHRGVTLEQFAAQLTPQQKAEAEQRARNFVPQRTGPEDF